MYFAAGALKEDTVFLFTDTQIVVEEFLEDINNILNSGKSSFLTFKHMKLRNIFLFVV